MRASVRRRVTLIVTLTALLPLLIVGTTIIALSYRSQQASATQQQLQTAQLLANEFDRSITEFRQQLDIFARSLAQNQDLSAFSDAQLKTLMGSSFFRSAALYRPTGERQAQYTPAGQNPLAASIAGSDILEQVQQLQPFFRDPAPFQATSLPLAPDEIPRLRIAVPVRISGGTLWVLEGQVGMDFLWNTTARQEQATGTTILIFSQNDSIISAAQTQVLLDHPDYTDVPLIAAGAESAQYRSPLGGDVLGTQAPIVQTGWRLIVEEPVEKIFAGVGEVALTLLLVIALALPVVVAIGLFAGARIVRPIQTLHQSVEQFSVNPEGYQPVMISTRDELAMLGNSFNTMVKAIKESQTSLAQANAELEDLVGSRTAQLQTALAEVQAQQNNQEQLLSMIRSQSMPVIPITTGMVVMPLVGDFSASRSEDIAPYMLQAIEQQHARIIVVDITGMVAADDRVARALVEATSAARLLGAEVILAGIRPDLAETLINVGIDLKAIRPAASLQQAFLLGLDLLGSQHRLSQLLHHS